MVNVVFFDFYRTLGVWGRPLEESLRKIAEAYGFAVDPVRYAQAREHLFENAADSDPTGRTFFGTMQEIVESYHQFIAALGVETHAEQVAWELLQSEHSLFTATSARLYDDTLPTLQRLREFGVKLAIVSNWDTPLDPLLGRLGIADYFDAIVASHDDRVKSKKPDPHIFNYTLAAVGATAAEAVHIGDTYASDIVGADRVGIRPILLDRDNTQAGTWDETIQSLSELPELLA